jgi:hypothetical protein
VASRPGKRSAWAIRYLVVNTGHWWLGHLVLVAPQWIDAVSWDDETVSVNLTRDAIKAAPPSVLRVLRRDEKRDRSPLANLELTAFEP